MKSRNFLSGLVITLLFAVVFSGCEKEPGTLLTDGIWNFENLTTDSEDEDIHSLVALAKALMTDATLEFQGAGTYIIDSPLMDEPTTGTWSLIGEDQLILDPDNQPPSTANIETLTKKELTYLETYSYQQMTPYTITTTWVRE